MKIEYPRRIEIVCEGYEEYDYLNRLKELDVFHKNYSLKLKNAKGIDNVFSVYSNEYQNNNSEVILVFCDTDLAPNEKYLRLCKDINTFHNKKRISDDIVMFVNPCTMQMMLSHFGDVKLKSNQKSANSSLIAKYTGIQDYRADENQRKALFNHMDKQNYIEMKERLSRIETVYSFSPSTNILKFLNNIETDNTKWMDSIIKQY